MKIVLNMALKQKGWLPGPLKVARRAPSLYRLLRQIVAV